jgi:hypothetical protein
MALMMDNFEKNVFVFPAPSAGAIIGMDNLHRSYDDSDVAKTLEEALKQDMKGRTNEA